MESQAKNLTLSEEIHSANGWFQIAVSNDGLTASVKKIVRHSGDGKTVNASDIFDKLKQLKVTVGIDQEVIENLVNSVDDNNPPEDSVVIAKGRAPVNDNIIKWHLDALTNKVIQPKDIYKRAVLPGQTLATINLNSKSTPGIDVFGVEIPKERRDEIAIECGEGVEKIKLNGCYEYKALSLGVIQYISGKLTVKSGIKVSDDKMKVTMSLLRPDIVSEEGDLSLLHVIKTLNDHGVKYGIKKDAINLIVGNINKERKSKIDLLVAEGVHATHGVDTRIEIDKGFSGSDKILPNGKIDYYHQSYPWKVKVNDFIGNIIPAQRSEDGRNVLSEVLIANIVAVSKPKLEGIRKQRDGTLRVTKDSILVTDGLNYKVSACLDIEGDLCQKTGNIQSNKSVNVHGFVESGIVLETKGDAIIQQNVENATVSAEGSIVIKSGVRGTYSKIIAGGDLNTTFAENAHLNVEGDILITNSIINCQTDCQGTVHVGDANSKKSAIQGETTHAYKGVEVDILGSDSFNKTIIEVGAGSVSITRLKEIVSKICVIEKGINDLTQVYEHYQKKIKSTISQKEINENNAMLLKLTDTQDQKNNVFDGLFEEKETIQNLVMHSKGVKVIVHERVYPGVVIHILNKTYEVKEERGSGVFLLKGANNL